MDTSKNVAILIFIIPIMLINFSDLTDAFKFDFAHKQLISIPYIPKSNPKEIRGYPFELDEQVQQLCHYAKMEDNLLYMNYDYLPTWSNYQNLWYITYCPTLPTIYLLIKDYEDYVYITYIRSSVNDYEFETEIIEETNTIFSINEEGEETRLNNLSLEDRRNLCVNAVKTFQEDIPIFLSTDVPEGQTYEFIISKRKKVHFSIPCPTSPKLYLSDVKAENKLKLILSRGSIDDYKFHIKVGRPDSVSSLPQTYLTQPKNGLLNLDSEERMALCARARKFTSLPVNDSNVPEAQLYLFQYSKSNENFMDVDIQDTEREDEIRDVAVQCQKVPKMYLRLEDPSQNIVTITLIRNPFERQQFESESHDLSYEKKSDQHTFGDIKAHPFSSLNKEDIWHLCSAAKEYLSPKTYSRLTVLPNRIEGPKMRGFIYYKKSGREVIAIKCSAEPAMYIFGNRKVATISLQRKD